jgi:uncharacterized membrane protein YgdD (TMEM256/DUF423 family)
MIGAADRVLVGLAALAGLLGVALSAAAAHAAGGANLETAARFLLVHAAALLGIAALIGLGVVAPGVGRAGALALIIGLALFCGDLSARALWSTPLFPRAAPTGGFLLMLGWALVALAAMFRVFRSGGLS